MPYKLYNVEMSVSFFFNPKPFQYKYTDVSVINFLRNYKSTIFFCITLLSRPSNNAKGCRWFSSGTPVFSTNKTDCHDKTEILLKVKLNTITLILSYKTRFQYC